MEQNRVKKILREGGLALGTHVGGIPDPQIVELIGLTGFDAAFCARPASTQPSFCASSIWGVQGVQVPHVPSAAVAREAVKAVRYPPEGERGMAAGSRAANFGKTPLLEHMARSNKELLLACMIEDMRRSSRSRRSPPSTVSTCSRSVPPTCRARSASAAIPTLGR
jgi:2-keto-3-deoxy-L-rhamnonate aldolase RhmA